jgi:hypothetical protein
MEHHIIFNMHFLYNRSRWFDRSFLNRLRAFNRFSIFYPLSWFIFFLSDLLERNDAINLVHEKGCILVWEHQKSIWNLYTSLIHRLHTDEISWTDSTRPWKSCYSNDNKMEYPENIKKWVFKKSAIQLLVIFVFSLTAWATCSQNVNQIQVNSNYDQPSELVCHISR